MTFAVLTDQRGNVHIAAAQITRRYPTIARRVRHEQDELNSVRESSRLILLSISGKNGSEKTRELSSHTTNAIDPVRRGADERGARLRT